VRTGVSDASFRIGELTATGLPDASIDAVLYTDAIQFPDEPASAYEEIRRVLKPGGRAARTCWEPLYRNDERLSPRIRGANPSAGLRQAGFPAAGRNAPGPRTRSWNSSRTSEPKPRIMPSVTALAHP
jgi:SAM-dependent methyltransferase